MRFFALQTYFAVVTKLIAVLALSLFVEDLELRLDEMKALDDASLHEDLEDLQRGGPFLALNLPNVLEPDVFGWFLSDWSPAVREQIRELLDRLSLYDPKTLEVSPEDARDLLKHLYQGLLPRPVRHALGQYFTPDWLAEWLLTKVGYDGARDVRLVDPACGTGTFLVLAIHRLKERLRKARVPESEILETIVSKLVGFDIDPLAVVAARTNYVLALGSLLRRPDRPLDVPVYLADSIVGPVEGETLETAGHLELPTAAGTFSLPACVDTEGELRLVCDRAARALEKGTPATTFVQEVGEICKASTAERQVFVDFYEQCQDLHRDGLDGLWPYVLRNAFMPAFIGDFDLVVRQPAVGELGEPASAVPRADSGALEALRAFRPRRDGGHARSRQEGRLHADGLRGDGQASAAGRSSRFCHNADGLQDRRRRSGVSPLPDR